jgi:hypothetical protein
MNTFIDNLANNLIKLDMNDFFKEIHSKYYNSIDISFMEYFLSLVEKRNEFCIEHDKLNEYKVLNNISTSGKILRCLESNNLIEGRDFNLSNVGQVRETTNGQNRGNVIVKQYKLTPYAFKLCLIRAKNSKDYAKYYLLLEECFYYYKSYQTLYQEKMITIKDDKIDSLSIEIKNQSEENKKQSKKIDKQSEEIRELLKHSKYTINKLDDISDENKELITNIDNLNDNIGSLNDKVEELRDDFKESLEDVNPRPENENNVHMFTLLQYKNNLNCFRIVRGQNKYLAGITKQDMNILIDRTYNPNPIDLFNYIKDTVRNIISSKREKIREDYNNKSIDRETKNNQLKELKNNPLISIKYNTITINENYSTNKLIDLINKCDNVRRDVDIP